jgi:hypothetical protein
MIRSVDLTIEEINFILDALEVYRMKGLVGDERTLNASVLPKLQAAFGTTDWVEMESSNIAKARYNGYANLLVIEFHNGQVWHYLDVPQKVWEALQAAESKGRYFGREIKGTYTAVPEAGPDDGAE